MKILISILLLLPFIASSQIVKETAPFGGVLINNNQVMIIERSDGSEITQVNNYKSFLTKEATTKNKLKIPSYVSKTPMQPFIYTKDNGKEYLTLDGRNWVRYEDKTMNATDVETEKPQPKNLYLIYNPKTPIESNFLVRFNLNSDSHIKFSLVNMQGTVVEEFEQNLPNGLNSINLNLSYLSTGTYIYRIQAGDEVISNKIIKL